MIMGSGVSLRLARAKCGVYAILLGCLGMASSADAAAKDLGNIMPIGDSITNGFPYATTLGGYRDKLVRDLVGAGYTFKMVGSRTNGSTYLTSTVQAGNEGHDGYLIAGNGTTTHGITENINTWIGPSGAAPDIILLMIGTNDMSASYGSPVGAPARLDALISMISDRKTGLRPDALLIVAGITLNTNATQDANSVAYNTAVAQVVNQHKLLGDRVCYVDMHPVLTTSDMNDWVHPSQSGYNKLGDAWFNAITTAIPEPTSLALFTLGAGCLLRRTRRRNA